MSGQVGSPWMDQDLPGSTREVVIVYTNYRGETSQRRIVPARMWFGPTDWHPQPQWMLDALDVDRDVERSFAVQDIRTWSTATSDVRS